jgi:ribosomal-protein-alanine N-acetyltransferase
MEAKTEILVQKLEASHLPSIATLERNCFPESYWSEDQILSHFESQQGIGIFHKSENFADKILCYVLYLENAWEIEILRIGTDPNYRRKNYASLCLRNLIQENSSKTILLEVDANNSKAIQLYRKHGFQFVDKRKAYYENGNDAHLFMRQGLLQ